MVRTYWFVSGFNEASDNLDLQPFARIDHVEACRPRADASEIVRVTYCWGKRPGTDGGAMAEDAAMAEVR